MKAVIRFVSVCLLALFPALLFPADSAVLVTATAGETAAAEKVFRSDFSLFVLVKAARLKPREIPDYGFIGIRSFPLRVKEYTFSARYIDKMNDEVKKLALKLQYKLPERRQKNAYYLASSVFDYVKNTVTTRAEDTVPVSDMHKSVSAAAEVLARGSGTALEKLRLATALLRSYQIPARIAGFKDRYVTEFYMKPLKGDAAWYYMDLSADCLTCTAGSDGLSYEDVVEWYPVDKKELLREELREGRAYFSLKGIKDTCLAGTDKAISDDFDAYVKGNKSPVSVTDCAKNTIILREYLYEIILPEGGTASADFTLPFNNRDTLDAGEHGLFITGKYFVKPAAGLRADFKRAHTKQNPPQDGMVYYLNVDFAKEQP